MILIIGAGGMLGKTVATTLPQFGVPFKVSSRKPYLLEAKIGYPIDAVYLDLQDPSTYANALKGVSKVVVTVHSLFGSGKKDSANVDAKGIIQLVEFCKDKNLEHFILVSVTGTSANHEIDFFRNKYASEQALIKSGIPYTIIQAPPFMELHIGELIGKSLIQKNKVSLLGSGNTKSNFVSVADLAQAICKLVNTQGANETLVLAGPQHATRNEIISFYGKQLNRTVKVSRISSKAVKRLAAFVGLFHKGIKRVLLMSAYFDENPMVLDTTVLQTRFSIKPVSIEEFVARHIVTLKKSK